MCRNALVNRSFGHYSTQSYSISHALPPTPLFATQTGSVSKIISAEWKVLPAAEKSHWEEQSAIDKERYQREWSAYIAGHNNATPPPKRPMSAYLAFSNSRRGALKKQHPEATNAEISGLLSQAWKTAPPEVVESYRIEEKKQWDAFHKARKAWREGSEIVVNANAPSSDLVKAENVVVDTTEAIDLAAVVVATAEGDESQQQPPEVEESQEV